MTELRKAVQQALVALEPYADIKPRDWKTDREKLWRAYDDLRAALAQPDVANAMSTVVAAMQADPDYAWSWHCNVAMAFVDAGGDSYTANQGAARFMRTLAQVEPAHELPAQPDVQEGYVLVPVEPTEKMWGELARDIIMWIQMTPAPRYGSKLHTHLTRLGKEIPDWLAKEIPNIDHTPSKGTVATCIYKAMLAAAPKGSTK